MERLAVGPIEAETPAERTARRDTRERSCDIGTKKASEENPASLGVRTAQSEAFYIKVVWFNSDMKGSTLISERFNPDLKGVRHPAIMRVR